MRFLHFLFVFSFLSVSISLRAQAPQYYNFELEDVTRTCQSVEARKPLLLRKHYLEIDGVKYYNEEVLSFENAQGYFVNTHHLNHGPNPRFAERIKHGRINFYEQVNFMVPVGNSNPSFRWNLLNGFTFDNVKHYYQLGDAGELKKFLFKDFELVVEDNPQALEYLHKSKRLHHTQTVIYVTSLLASGIATAFHVVGGIEDDEHLINTGTIVSLGGLVGYGVTYLFNYGKVNNIKRAVDSYNRF